MLNKWIGMGRLTKDAEVRYTSNEKAFARFTVAVDEGYGENKKTNFINCIAWGKTAEFIQKYFQKGSMIIVDGRIQTGSYEKEGKKVYTTDVVADNVSFGEGKGESKPQAGETIENDTEGFVPIDMDDEFPF